MEELKCKDKVANALENRLEDLRILWAGYCNDECLKCEGLGEIKKSPNSKAKNPKMIDCPLCGGVGKLDENISEYGTLNEYGLSFDYCTPEKEHEGYFRYQISWGGPSEEFRIYADKAKYGWKVRKIDFWYLDWFDGAKVSLSGDDYKFMETLLESFFLECSGDFEYEKAIKDWEPDYDEEEESEDEE